jgi:hypothetical protein
VSLLLRELAAVMRQETGAQRVIITERGERNEPELSLLWVVRRRKPESAVEIDRLRMTQLA